MSEACMNRRDKPTQCYQGVMNSWEFSTCNDSSPQAGQELRFRHLVAGCPFTSSTSPSLENSSHLAALEIECAPSNLNETRTMIGCTRGWRIQSSHDHGIANLARWLERARSGFPSRGFRGKHKPRKQLTLTAPILIVN